MAKEATPARSNGYNKDQLKGYISRVETVEGEIASEMGAAMNRVRGMRDDIKDILTEAKGKGIPLKALKAELKLRKLDREKEKAVAGLEEDDRESLEAIQAALGDFASTPLGNAVLAAHQ